MAFTFERGEKMQLICGVHGVGKTIFAKTFCQKKSLSYYSASELIRKMTESQICDYKKVQQVTGNQKLLLEALSKIEDKQYILDGHLCLINGQNKIERIQAGIFQKLNIECIYIVVDKPKKIQQRLKERDDKNWNVNFIDLFQKEEFEYAKYLTGKMYIPLKIIYENEEVMEVTFLKKENIILPVKPVFADKILNGTKKYEYRKQLCQKEIDKIYIYATSPEKMIVGEVEVINKIKMDKSELWLQTHEYSGISKEFYDRYFKAQNYACAYKIGAVKRYSSPVTLEHIGLKYAPQSHIYVGELELC